MAVFLPIYRCTGVDTSGMIVPLGGSNQVVLDTDGMAYNVEHPGMELEEFDGKDIGRQLIKLNNSLYDPSIDPNYRAAPAYCFISGEAALFQDLWTIKI